MTKATDMTPIFHIKHSDIDMTQPISELSATEIIEKELKDSEQVNRAHDLFTSLMAEGNKKEATKVYWFALLNYNVSFSNE